MTSFTPPAPLRTPVLFLVFNRPDNTARVFEAIRQAKPPRLYVAADGPRADREGEAEKVAKVREIATTVDWPCEVKTLFREKNLGCKYAVSGAITWFFEQEEHGIILEDDCLPSQSFFYFCEQLLDYYKQDTRILHIGGTNPLAKGVKTSSTYYFSEYNRIWGWATWRRAWRKYDPEITFWPDIKRKDVLRHLLGKDESRKFTRIFSKVYENKIDTWDYQWLLIRLLHGRAIIPDVNLISNIGFGSEATHTKSLEHKLANLPLGEIIFPLQHPEFLIVNRTLDMKWAEMRTEKSYFLKNLIRGIKKVLK